MLAIALRSTCMYCIRWIGQGLVLVAFALVRGYYHVMPGGRMRTPSPDDEGTKN